VSDTRNPATVLPGIKSLPIPEDAQVLFCRAVRLALARPELFKSTVTWLESYYSECVMREQRVKEYRAEFGLRRRNLRGGSLSFCRRLVLRRAVKASARLVGPAASQFRAVILGRTLEELAKRRIEVALGRGQRLVEGRIVTRGHPDPHPGERVVDETNVQEAWASDDRQYREAREQIVKDRREVEEEDVSCFPERPEWRLDRAVRGLVSAEHPQGAEHLEHSKKVIVLASLLMPEHQPELGQFGSWSFESTLDLDSPTSGFLEEVLVEGAKAASKGPFGYLPSMLDRRFVGREEVMFVREPGAKLTLRPEFPLEELVRLLAVALDEVEAACDVHDDKANRAPSHGPLSFAKNGVEPGAVSPSVDAAARRESSQAAVADLSKWPRKSEVAQILKVHPGSVTRWCDDGRLTTAIDRNGVERVEPASVLRLQQERRSPDEPTPAVIAQAAAKIKQKWFQCQGCGEAIAGNPTPKCPRCVSSPGYDPI
jgi:hypothetical protein